MNIHTAVTILRMYIKIYSERGPKTRMPTELQTQFAVMNYDVKPVFHLILSTAYMCAYVCMHTLFAGQVKTIVYTYVCTSPPN